MNLNKSAAILEVLAHPLRLRILFIIVGSGSISSGDIVEATGHRKCNISKHLTVLKNADLVTSKKKSTQVFYSMNSPLILPVLNALESLS